MAIQLLIQQVIQVNNNKTIKAKHHLPFVRGIHWCKGQECRVYIDGLVQERRNSSANALELRLFCTNPSTCPDIMDNDSTMTFNGEISIDHDSSIAAVVRTKLLQSYQNKLNVHSRIYQDHINQTDWKFSVTSLVAPSTEVFSNVNYNATEIQFLKFK